MKTTKEEIRATALRLFAQRGFDAVSVEDICAELGITKGSFYHHYSNKCEPLLERVKKEIDAPERLFRALEAVESPRERLWLVYKWGFYDVYQGIDREGLRSIWVSNIGLSGGGITAASFAPGTALGRYLAETVFRARAAGEIHNGADPAQLLRAMQFAGAGCSIDWSSGGADEDFLTNLRNIFDTILH